MNNKNYDYENDLDIDLNNLHFEFKDHSQTYMKYQELLTTAELNKNKAKEFLDVTEAELDFEIRNDYKENGEKFTEAIVKAEIIRHPKRKSAVEDYNQKIYDYNLLRGAATAFEHRKKMLEKSADLYICGYYSTPVHNDASAKIESESCESISNKVIAGLRKDKK